MSSKYSFNCNYCYQNFENITKEDFLVHLERCLSSKESFTNNKPIDTYDNNMNIASFTFGGKKESNAITNVFQINQNFQLEDRQRQDRSNNHNSNSYVRFNDRIGSHNSFMVSIIHTIINMKSLCEYIIHESKINEDNEELGLFELKVKSLN